ncbi:MAG: hypothetical protein CYPHOPRED_002173 [Cyphobasidiales sp. Tagirdzhanova-0007]|nr:MAG: hypothetical protein CYPHOPRED_002173 [Cyphobasidiales sp. Tagirdzhanova-0007]
MVIYLVRATEPSIVDHVFAAIHAAVDRATLTRLAHALIKRDGLKTLQLDFSMPDQPLGVEVALRLPLSFVSILSSTGHFYAMSSISIANLTIPVDSQTPDASALFEAFCRLLQSLPYLKSVMFANLALPTARLRELLPKQIESIEILDTSRNANVHDLTDAIAQLPKLKYLRIMAYDRSFLAHILSTPRNINDAAITKLPTLQTLCLDSVGCDTEGWLLSVLSYLENPIEFPKLHTLAISCCIRGISDEFPTQRLARAIGDKVAFPAVRCVQLPSSTYWHEPSQFHWTHALQKALIKDNIDLKLDENENLEFRKFQSASQEQE